jgi:hypothetical protein
MICSRPARKSGSLPNAGVKGFRGAMQVSLLCYITFCSTKQQQTCFSNDKHVLAMQLYHKKLYKLAQDFFCGGSKPSKRCGSHP